MVRTEGLTHIHLRVSDLGRSLAFYQQVFGLEEMFREGPNMGLSHDAWQSRHDHAQ